MRNEGKICSSAAKEARLPRRHHRAVPVLCVLVHLEVSAILRPSTHSDDVAKLGRVVLALVRRVIGNRAHAAPHVTFPRSLAFDHHEWAVRANGCVAPARVGVVSPKECLRIAGATVELILVRSVVVVVRATCGA